MQVRTGRATIVLLGLSAVALAACTPVTAPPPPPPPPTTQPPASALCPSTPTPGPEDKVAIVDQDNGPTTAVPFEASSSAQEQQEVAALDQTGTVLAVGQDKPVSALAISPNDDTYYPAPNSGPGDASLHIGQWGFPAGKMDFPTAWNTNNMTGNNVRIGVVDTGVQGNHPDLAGAVVAGKDFISPGLDGTQDGNGHGTHVAGILAARDNTIGVVGGAPNATIVPARVLDCQGSGTYADVENGMLWASDTIANGGGGVQVINLSLGGFSDDPGLHSALQTVVNRGVVVVAAAGNCGGSATGCPSTNAPLYPGVYNEAIAVGSIDSGGAKSSFSNDNSYVDVAGPGGQIPSTYTGSTYKVLSGTSMATPHVAAVAALLTQECQGTTSPATFASSAWVTFVRNRITSNDSVAIPTFTAASVGLAQAGAATAAAATPACPA